MSQKRIKDGRAPGAGATGKFPQGKIHPSDEGELRFGIAVDREHGVVVLDFGQPVSWIGLPPDIAVQLAELLIEGAKECPARRKPS